VNHFVRRRGELYCEDVPLLRIAERVGTPVYVYSTATLLRHASVFRSALRGLDVLPCYAVKAAGNLALLRLLLNEDFGFDIVSGGELHRVLRAGADPRRIVFSGVGKREDELRAALRAGILQFNCESEEELEQLDAAARSMRRRAPIAVRVNPQVDARTHPYIATALATSKFGVPAERARAAFRRAGQLPGLEVVGLACHIGSQIGEVRPFLEAARKMRALFDELRAAGQPLRRLDLGGGLGVPYGEGPDPASPEQYGRALYRALRGLDARILVEPGRLLVANAGILLTRILLIKRGAGGRRFAVADAGMNDLLRPALYGAYHAVETVARPRAGSEVIDLVGPVCESADVLAARRRLPPLRSGDLLVLRTAGAYAMSMASQYNARPRPAEVLVSGSRFRVVRRRETQSDLVRGETV